MELMVKGTKGSMGEKICIICRLNEYQERANINYKSLWNFRKQIY